MKLSAKRLSQQITKVGSADFAICFGIPGCPLAYLETDIPLVFWADASFASLIEAYPEYSNLCESSIRQAHQYDQDLLTRADLAVYSSAWAAEAACANYQVDPKKVVVVPFGSNFDTSLAPEEVNCVIDSRSQDTCRLLFIGSDWERKGGSICLEAVKALNQMNIPATLHIVGKLPEAMDSSKNPAVFYEGFLNKQDPVSKERLSELFKSSHFLILPSRIDCTPMVIAEAGSFALPTVATAVGGIPSMILPGANGVLLDPSASGQEFASAIAGFFKDKEKYRQLALSSYGEYCVRLNWTANISKLLSIAARRFCKEPSTTPDSKSAL